MTMFKKWVAVVVMAVAMSPAVMKAQTKVGHADFQELVTTHPDYILFKNSLDSVRRTYEGPIKELEGRMRTMNDEYQKAQAAKASDVELQRLGTQFQNLQTRVEGLNKEGQTEMQKLQDAKLAPILDKVKKAVTAVAKENGYQLIVDSGAGENAGSSIFLYADEAINVTSLVKKKLGIK